MRPWVARALLIVCWLVVWEVASQIILLTPGHSAIIATPLQVLGAFQRMAYGTSPLSHFSPNLLLTFYEIAVAFLISASIGLSTGMLIGQFRLIEESLEPIIIALVTIPNYVLFPILFFLFGIGPSSDIAFGVLLGFFPVLANTIAGARSVDPQILSLGRTMGASTSQMFRKVILPASAGPVISGLKQGFAFSVIGVIAGEILIPISGIGYLLNYAQGFFYPAELEAVIIIVVALAIGGNVAFSRIERKYV